MASATGEEPYPVGMSDEAQAARAALGTLPVPLPSAPGKAAQDDDAAAMLINRRRGTAEEDGTREAGGAATAEESGDAVGTPAEEEEEPHVPVHVTSSAAAAVSGLRCTDPMAAMMGGGGDATPTKETSELSIAADEEIPWENRVREAADRDGETLVTIGPVPTETMDLHLERLAQVSAMVACDTTLVHTQEHPTK
mmetsp:Transcript_23796/g.60858  ORF Transcript_23796/g.60858 Transcript_23796/m.60858 type:complete len:196 (+) Transcript_23796:63-650(+)